MCIRVLLIMLIRLSLLTYTFFFSISLDFRTLRAEVRTTLQLRVSQRFLDLHDKLLYFPKFELSEC